MIAATDTIILTAIRIGLADIRRNPYLIDDIMCQFMEDRYLKDSWGKQQIDRFKDFLAKKQINIVMETRLPDLSKLPAIVIKIGGGSEDPQKQGLGDSDHFESVDPATLGGAYPSPNIILGPVTPESYDPATGELVFPDDVSLDKVFEGQFVYDEVNKQAYEIQIVLNKHTLLIDTDLKADFTNMTIRPTRDIVRHNKKSIWFYEDYTITCISTEPNELMFLYSLCLYIFGRYKKTLFEARNFEIGTYSYSPVYIPNPSDDTNLLFARDLNVRGRVQHTFIESTSAAIEGISPELLIDANVDQSVTSSSVIAATKTPPGAYYDQVKKQGWKMEADKEYDTEDDENNE
jgi:hypothetical protein